MAEENKEAKKPEEPEAKPPAKPPAKVEGQPEAKAKVAEQPPAKVEGKPEGKAKVAEQPPAKVEGKPEGKAKKATEQTEQTAAEVMADPDGETVAQVKKGRGRGRTVPVGIAHIKATFNNTIVSITDPHGGLVSWSNGGRVGFKGSRKSTAFAATLVGREAARQAVGRGMHELEVRVQGAGSGRESAIRAIQASGLVITMIKDVTPMPHNGCRARKRRRV